MSFAQRAWEPSGAFKALGEPGRTNLISSSEPKLLKRFVMSSRLSHTKGVAAEDRNFLSLFGRDGALRAASDEHLCIVDWGIRGVLQP